ncbi:hypothetical protein [Microcoleus sp. CAWBG58]|uniref:hypothetical protein n=1 Tax=Microcoleus sp. CAWBG58 TaxID=2841651 RepID=UPI0025EB051D|nr:hypothetical protein [Microcoleus sp. CAWBG58]
MPATHYQKELVESPPTRSGEIKIGLFITPILELRGRGRYQTVKRSIVPGQLLNNLLVSEGLSC